MSLDLDAPSDEILSLAAERFGTPCYVYMLDDILERAKLLNDIFEGRIQISYAVKANRNRTLLREISNSIGTLDVSSGGELLRGIECGYDPQRMSFSGPGKSMQELETAVDVGCGEVIAESVNEIAQLDALAEDRGTKVNVVLRVSPKNIPKGFGVNMAGRPSQFGVDEEMVDAAMEEIPKYKNIHFAGFHIYAGAQCLNLDAIIENFSNYIDVFTEYSERHNLSPERLIFGGGIGIPYQERDTAIDLEELGSRLNPMLDKLLKLPNFKNAKCFLEIGRLLVGEAGYFLTGVRRGKHSRGKEIRICDGGLNNHLAACGHFGSVIHRNYPIAKLGGGNEVASDDDAPYDVFGPLCTTIDQLARDLKVPSLEPGDVLAIGSSGAYGYSASPMQFISHPPAKEVLALTKNGKVQLRDISEHSA